MGQYKRMVSYLYKYINGAKSQNTGFVRIELMDVQCRFTVQMRMVPFEVFPKVYLYIQKEHGAKCIEVSDMGTKSGNLVSRFALDKNNIEQTGYSFEDIDGLVVYISDEMFFATSWVRDEVKLGQIEIVSKTREMPADSIFETENTKRLNENNISESSNTGRKNIYESGNMKSVKEKNVFDMENEKRLNENNTSDIENAEKLNENNIFENVSDECMQVYNLSDNSLADKGYEMNDTEKFGKYAGQNMDSDEVASVAETRAESDINTEKMVIKASVYEENDKDFGERILSTFPVMYPFASGIIDKSVRIELKDIGCLPIKMWVLANNTFLLHGYCSYRHIIFAKIKISDIETQYAVGSPGIYNSYDENIARQHGFIYFQPIGEVKDKNGTFGYWIHPLK
ncbi:hypothetical protein DWZ63_06045 [Clostridium sp. AF34-13]|uniref:DUF6128 domain-containing protein n=1 Tax=Butyribacter intestini TaxID=1703332 RepID=A0AAW3JS14_9FIRM|nr:MULTISPECIES: DUF6128 domain-containing protein [Clostridia]KQC85230.1 hypothetical protein APZ18_11070 [Butyribacter intestini]RHP26134.1 hypothetical protein DWZ63_06045 [Clostridium sp. AF34-13]RHU74510.1 hypothetical protein DXC30_11200 [Butyribacter intestini]